MAPARTSGRRAQRAQTSRKQNNQPQDNVEKLFLDPMSGQPLQLYIEKDVDSRDNLVESVIRYGGVVSPGYSGVMYILVDPLKDSGQSLYRQYANKKNKIILNAHWVYHCIRDKTLHGFASNWADCKVTGQEHYPYTMYPPAYAPPVHPSGVPPMHPSAMSNVLPPAAPVAQASQAGPSTSAAPPQTVHGHPMPITASSYGVQPPLNPDGSAPPQTWQAANAMPGPPPNLPPPPPGYPRYDYREWSAYAQPPPPGAATPHQPPPPPGAMQHPEYDYRYGREHEQPQWVPDPAAEYYAQQYGAQYAFHQEQQVPEAGPSNAEPSREETPARGRKRTRTQPQPAPPASTLVMNRRNPPARSPTPPSRVIKSTYGGNLFTSEDVLYLKKYIDYCQEQGLVLSLREICERIAVKAPHHTFYSWRRYCNKHQIRLGGYAMELDHDEEDPAGGEGEPQQEIQEVQEGLPGDGPLIAELPQQPQGPTPGVHPGSIAMAKQRAGADIERTRSPTPPRALYRSTTGKGVAFTDEDVIFLVRFLEYRTRTQDGKVDMVTFWKDVAAKVRRTAPHHSRASWMKFYRRHKHELEHKEGDDPLPPPPPKKMRYTKADDVLLARFFANRPEGTTDKVFQDFGRTHPHHPWKGWQEHHRIHKAKIDHLITKVANGEEIDESEDGPE
ncbi:hypothetical protein PHLGIDRAFT_90682 [Phlebiopsis gigantea 11061_1 CR5-6]|uniref:Uncharacterized protein n=1 Tax=Phlebiopsis gigantea (strain 11061_1 CR5-6) TaxID=745531 RepID=A0A0C3RXJ1_PHLG1|nr:hypothetical protein PHLGIDRAFT_90682 [Phlebiopsis gigantea 11061_1 CR5-6]